MVALIFAAGGGAYASTSIGTGSVAGWAVVNPNGNLARGSGALSSGLLRRNGQVFPGDYQVVFDQNVSNCSFQATIGSSDASVPTLGDIGVARRTGNPDAVYVRTTNFKGFGADRGFHLAVIC
jgi:hypothetical protein